MASPHKPRKLNKQPTNAPTKAAKRCECRPSHRRSSPRLTRPPATPVLVKLYLLAYNVASAIGWSYVLYTLSAYLLNLNVPGARTEPATFATDPVATVTSAVERVLALLARLLPFLRPTAPASTAEHIQAQLPDAARPLWARAARAFGAVGAQTALVQSGAALEVLHALAGWVRSPVATTAMQVASRLFLVWGIADRFESVRSSSVCVGLG